MFAIKGRHFKVECEGLHLLCLHWGKYNHTSDGFEAHKRESTIKDGGQKNTPTGSIILEEQVGEQGNATSTWTIVQKTKRGRRSKQDISKEDLNKKRNKDLTTKKGSRFQALLKDSQYEDSNNTNVTSISCQQETLENNCSKDARKDNSKRNPQIHNNLETPQIPEGHPSQTNKKSRAR